MPEHSRLGESVCDMHYGLPTETYTRRSKVETRNHIQINLNGSAKVLQSMLLQILGIAGTPINKIAVIVDFKFDGWIVAAYSYDDRHFGMFEFREIIK